ncbi:T9SS type A sorting domain-containing protein, partial [Crocinitomicaceae bacterium]|nr:T9SS type A sorting domain-containing protein [Crocinitomicaceae bacterium]
SNVLIDVIGLDELSFNQLNIAPNPANDYYSINSTFGGNMIVKMYNLQGKSMTEFDTKNEEKISLREWQSGSYFLVIDMNGTLVSKKLIIE